MHKPEQPAKAVIYARFSPRKNAADCESCERQIEICANYCLFHKTPVIGTFQDDNMSGSLTTDQRPGLQAAVNLAVKHSATLVVYSLSRLARNTRETLEILERLEKAKANLASTREKIDTSGYMGRFVFRLLAAIAEMEREQISERTRDIMLAHQAAGRRMSKDPPFGWQTDPMDSSRLIENPQEQQAVRRILELAENGSGLRQICRTLADEGYEARKIQKPFKGRLVTVKGNWHHSLIKGVLNRSKNASR